MIIRQIDCVSRTNNIQQFAREGGENNSSCAAKQSSSGCSV